MITTITFPNGMECHVDTDVWECELKYYSWRVVQNNKGSSCNWYVRGYGKLPGEEKARNILMHRVIMNAPKNLLVDHIDRNGLNNTKANLRFANAAQNQHNRRKADIPTTSRFKGVSRHSEDSWQGMIRVDDKNEFLGTFKSEVKAALAYDQAAVIGHKEFAGTNFPVELVNYITALQNVAEATREMYDVLPSITYLPLDEALAALGDDE